MGMALCQSIGTCYRYVPVASDASGPSRASSMSLVVMLSSSGAAAAVTAATQPPGGTGGGCMLSCCVSSARGAFHIWSQNALHAAFCSKHAHTEYGFSCQLLYEPIKCSA